MDLRIREEVDLNLGVTNTLILKRHFENLYLEQMIGKNEQERAGINLMLCTIYNVALGLRKDYIDEQISVGREFWAVGTGLISMFLRYEKTSPTLTRLLTGNFTNPQIMLEELSKQGALDKETDLWQMLGWLEEWRKIT